MSTTRTIVIPIVNPDGFNASREAGQLFMNGDGAGTDVDGSGDISDPEFILAAAAHPNEYRRKNCRLLVGDGGNCNQVDTGVYGPGVDPNRNYGAFWGGPGGGRDQPADPDLRAARARSPSPSRRTCASWCRPVRSRR